MSLAENTPQAANASREKRASDAYHAVAVATLEHLIFNDETLDNELRADEYAINLAFIKTLVMVELYRAQTASTTPKSLRVLSTEEAHQHKLNEEREDIEVLTHLKSAFGSRADNDKGHERALTAQMRARGVLKGGKLKDTPYAIAAAGRICKTKTSVESEDDDEDVGDEQSEQERNASTAVIVLPQQIATCTTCARKNERMFECNGVEICPQCELNGDKNCGVCILFQRCCAPVCVDCCPGDEVMCAMCTQTENPEIERCTNCNHTVHVKDNKLFACDNDACDEHEICYQCVLDMNNELDMTATELRDAAVPCSNDKK